MPLPEVVFVGLIYWCFCGWALPDRYLPGEPEVWRSDTISAAGRAFSTLAAIFVSHISTAIPKFFIQVYIYEDPRFCHRLVGWIAWFGGHVFWAAALGARCVSWLCRTALALTGRGGPVGVELGTDETPATATGSQTSSEKGDGNNAGEGDRLVGQVRTDSLLGWVVSLIVGQAPPSQEMVQTQKVVF